jgi:predicted TPR repeat methyltransferase
LWKNGRAEAQNGYNDDLVMACSIGCYLRETSFKLRQHGMDMSRNMLDSIATNKSHYDGAYNASGVVNPYKIENPYTGGSEDISWLL